MNHLHIAFAVGAATIVSCSPTGNPQLDMCLKITSNLMQSDLEFGESSQQESDGQLQLTLPFTDNTEPGEALCVFASESASNKEYDEGRYKTSPKTVVLNGREVGTKELFKATFASSKSVLKDSALEAKDQTLEAAGDAKVSATAAAEEAKDKAAELAREAKVKATELAGDARAKTEEIADKVKDSGIVSRAKALADTATEKARNAALEGTRKIQEKLEKEEPEQ